MQTDIKCLECGKGTRYFELGDVFYEYDHASETVLVKNEIICPKCGKDISNERCLVKESELLMCFVVANLTGKDAPAHLKRSYPLIKREYDMIKQICKAKPKLVQKF